MGRSSQIPLSRKRKLSKRACKLRQQFIKKAIERNLDIETTADIETNQDVETNPDIETLPDIELNTNNGKDPGIELNTDINLNPYVETNQVIESKENERVIIDLQCLESLVNKGVAHAKDCTTCAFEVKSASSKILELHCKSCLFSCVQKKDDPESHALTFENALVIGSYCGGIGYNAVRFLLNSAEIQMINSRTFRKAEEKVGPIIKEQLDKELKLNISEEKKLALENEEFYLIDGKKIPFITVIVDGGWAKRSYGHSYNSNSGCAVIIGARTKKVLFMGSRVKTCCICDKIGKTAPKHLCYKNWTDSSQAMEANIIVSGFQESYKEHEIIYKYVIGDADSSVYAQLQSQVVYPRRIPIEKIDCSNHAVRGLNTKIYSIVNNTSFPKADRDRVMKHINRFGKDMRAAITYNSKHRFSTDPAIKTSALTLATDISNIPAHVFGDHAKCKKYFCKGGGEDCYKTFISTPAGIELLSSFRRLANRAPRLIYDTTSNHAESFMSIASKYISGKRVNYSQRGSYVRRIQAAVLAFNNGPFWPLKRLNTSEKRCRIWNNAEKYFKRTKKQIKKKSKTGPFGRCAKKNFTADAQKNYGPFVNQGNLTDSESQVAVASLISELQVTVETRDQIQIDTVGQIYNEKWKLQRRNRLTASHAGKIYKLRDNTNNRCTLKALLYPHDLSKNENIIRGINLEPAAKSLYSLLYDTEVIECGLFIDIENGVLGASPDGLIGTDGILEIKCPNCKVDQIPCRKDKYLVKIEDKLQLNRNHAYFHQVIMQLYVTGKTFCDFFVYYENSNEEAISHFKERIFKDKDTDALWKKMKEKLLKFYTLDMAPEIVDPVFPTTKQFRTPEYRKAAIVKNRNQSTKTDISSTVFQS